MSTHTDLREPEKFSYLPMVTQRVSEQQALVTVQVVMILKCFGSDRRVQQEDIVSGMGSAA